MLNSSLKVEDTGNVVQVSLLNSVSPHPTHSSAAERPGGFMVLGFRTEAIIHLHGFCAND